MDKSLKNVHVALLEILTPWKLRYPKCKEPNGMRRKTIKTSALRMSENLG